MKKNNIIVFLSFCVMLILISITTLTVCAKDYGDFNISVPVEYTTVVEDDDKSDIAEIIGVQNTEIESYFEKNNLLLFSVDKNNNSQIKLSVFSDDFSNKIISFNNLDNTRLIQLANSFFTGDYEQVNNNTEIVENNNLKFLKYTESLSDSGGEYTVTQFVTVSGKKNYRLSIITTAEQTTDFVNDIFYSFSIEAKNTNPSFSVTNVLIISGIIAFSAVIVYTVISIAKSHKKDNYNEREPSD